MARGARFWFQHDAALRSGSRVSVFDDGAGPPQREPASRGLILTLDLRRHVARMDRQYRRSNDTSAQSEGSLQTLPGGDAFAGFGATPYFSQFTNAGKLVFDASLPADDGSYRVYSFPWSTTPTTKPAVAAQRVDASTVAVYASWNGATRVARWQVLAGPTPGRCDQWARPRAGPTSRPGSTSPAPRRRSRCGRWAPTAASSPPRHGERRRDGAGSAADRLARPGPAPRRGPRRPRRRAAAPRRGGPARAAPLGPRRAVLRLRRPAGAVAVVELVRRCAAATCPSCCSRSSAGGSPDDPAVEAKRRYALTDAARRAGRAGLTLVRREPVAPRGHGVPRRLGGRRPAGPGARALLRGRAAAALVRRGRRRTPTSPRSGAASSAADPAAGPGGAAPCGATSAGCAGAGRTTRPRPGCTGGGSSRRTASSRSATGSTSSDGRPDDGGRGSAAPRAGRRASSSSSPSAARTRTWRRPARSRCPSASTSSWPTAASSRWRCAGRRCRGPSGCTRCATSTARRRGWACPSAASTTPSAPGPSAACSSPSTPWTWGASASFVLEASRGIWAEAVDVAADAGLRAVSERAGLDWDACRAALGDPALRVRVDASTARLDELGHWGVPVLVHRGELFWGQDHLDDLEAVLREDGLERDAHAGSPAQPRARRHRPGARAAALAERPRLARRAHAQRRGAAPDRHDLHERLRRDGDVLAVARQPAHRRLPLASRGDADPDRGDLFPDRRHAPDVVRAAARLALERRGAARPLAGPRARAPAPRPQERPRAAAAAGDAHPGHAAARARLPRRAQGQVAPLQARRRRRVGAGRRRPRRARLRLRRLGAVRGRRRREGDDLRRRARGARAGAAGTRTTRGRWRPGSRRRTSPSPSASSGASSTPTTCSATRRPTGRAATPAATSTTSASRCRRRSTRTCATSRRSRR